MGESRKGKGDCLAATDAILAQLVRRMAPGSELLRAWPLLGGVSAEVTALELLRPDGSTCKLIMRRHGEVDRRNNPQIAADEFRLLQVLQAANIAAPRPCYLDRSCELWPTPYLVVEYIEGQSAFAPADLDDCVRQMAAQLADIHAVASRDLDFLPAQADRAAGWFVAWADRPAQSPEQNRAWELLWAGYPPAELNRTVLLHGDYWPGNLLWRDGTLIGVIDWEDAELGDPLVDLANTRLAVLWAFGPQAMADFTAQYCSLTAVDCSQLPWWDLWAALRAVTKISGWGLPVPEERQMRESLTQFIRRASDRIRGK